MEPNSVDVYEHSRGFEGPEMFYREADSAGRTRSSIDDVYSSAQINNWSWGHQVGISATWCFLLMFLIYKSRVEGSKMVGITSADKW